MCVIVYKPKNVRLPDEETLRTCYINNGDGIGYTFTDNKHNVIVKKGYTTFNDFYNELLEDYHKHNLRNHNLILHFRIGTSGGLTKEKAQPFKITNSIEELNKLYIKNKKASIVHNGILHAFEYDETNSDTQNYIKDFLHPILNCKKIKADIKSELIKDTLNDVNKLAILTNNDHVSLYGEYIRDNGVYYSNNSYNFYTNNVGSILFDFTNHERRLIRRYKKDNLKVWSYDYNKDYSNWYKYYE